jgi:hypothetical protein
LRFSIKTNPQQAEEKIKKALQKHCTRHVLFRLDLSSEGEKHEYDYQYKVILKNSVTPVEIIQELNQLEEVSKLRFSIKAEQEEV